MRKKLFTFLLALTASIGMMWAETVVVINKSEFTSSGVTKEGVTLALSNGSMTSSDVVAMNGSFEFSTSLGKFTGITIETDANIMEIYEGAYTSAGWPTGDNLGTSAVWTGESETVLISCMVAGMDNITITCTIEPTPVLAVANTLQLHVNDALMGSVALQDPSNDIFDFGDGTYGVPEGAEVTLIATPNEGYEFIGWKASSSICDFNECEFVALPTVDNPLTFDMYQEAAFMAEFAAVASQPQIGPKEVLDLGTTGCLGEHYQLTGGGTNIYRTVGGVDNKMITIESLHGEIIDNISLKLYYYNVWTGYSVAASSGDVSSWNYDAYEDLVITNINATSVTLSRVGSGQENGYVMFEKVTINNSDEPTPQPTTEEVITNEDPENPSYHYSTFFHSTQNYKLTNDGTQAFIATLSNNDLVLTKIAEGTQVIPANTAVILRKSGSADPVVLTPTEENGVSFSANNDLLGVDAETAAPENCYVLSGTDQYGVGFYQILGNTLKAHKAYVIYSGNAAPKRMRFVFNTTTDVESIQPSAVSIQKILENGQVIIIRNGVRYNAAGQIVK